MIIPNVSKQKILYTVQHATEMNTEKLDEQGNADSCIKTPDYIILDVSVPPHYNRINSDKRYLPAYLTRCILHKGYKKEMLVEGKESVAFFKYSRIQYI